MVARLRGRKRRVGAPGMKVALSAVMRIRLLLVENEISTMFAMREFLTQVGYAVDCATGLQDAASLLDEHLYQAVITDLHLTTYRCGEGMRVAWHARRRNPHACIVMLTGYGNDGTEAEARRSGVDMYQTKPVALDHLSAFVELMLQPDHDPAKRQELERKWRQH